MYYKQSFRDLFNHLQSTSEAVVTSSGITSNVLIDVFNGSSEIDVDALVKKLIELSIDNPKIDYNSMIWALSKPHIGLGNPNANLLIIGMELGFEESKEFPAHALKHWQCSSSPVDYYKRLFINEVLLNYYLWYAKVHGQDIPGHQLCRFQNPEFPPSFCHLFNKEKRGLHTWKMISNVVEHVAGQTFQFTTDNPQQSFFRHCFLTELNLVPSSKSIFIDGLTRGRISIPDIERRFHFLTHNGFYTDFKSIVFGCRSYLKQHIDQYEAKIEKAYNVKKDQFFTPTRNIKEVYVGENKRIFVTNQMSGANAWSKNEFELLGSMIGNVNELAP